MVDPKSIAGQLQSLFNIAFYGSREIFDGEWVYSVRPSGIELGNGFSIFYSKTPRHIEIVFKLDNFAGTLLREMADSDKTSLKSFDKYLNQALDECFIATLQINGENVAIIEKSEFPVWNTFSLDLVYRLQKEKNTQAEIDELVFKGCYMCCNMVLNLMPLAETEIFEFENYEKLPEGTKLTIQVNRYERNPVNRANCIRHYGAVCQCCGFDFFKVYGLVGSGFIEVHHVKPVSEIGDNYLVDPIEDLIPLCSNCHSMIHRRVPQFSLSELQTFISNKS